MTPEDRLKEVDRDVQEIKDLMHEARRGIKILCGLLWVILLAVLLKGEWFGSLVYMLRGSG